MEAISASEARGDASNLKGTDYHLLYVLWCLLRKEAETVYFFQGNDLLATPIAPPSPESQDSLSTSAVACLANQQDNWIQLKCTTTAWTCSQLLDDNLLDNFICNTLLSESKGHTWKVILVTTSEIRTENVLQFLSDPSASPNLLTKLDMIVEKVGKKLANSCLGSSLSHTTIKDRAIEILRALAQCETLPQRVLRAEIAAELAFGLVDRQVASAAQQQLIGALLQDTAQGPERARGYDCHWMRSVTGHDFLSVRPLDDSVAHGCDAQVATRLPRTFSAASYTPRTQPLSMLEKFLHAPEPVFLLTGHSGTGKSWLLAHWASATLSGRARLLIPGDRLREHTSLVSFIADELRPLTALVADDQTLFQKVAFAALSNTFGPFVVILDNVQPFYDNPAKFAHMVATLVDDAKRHHIKLLLACQTDVHRNLKLSAHLNADDVFQMNTDDVFQTASYGETVSDIRQGNTVPLESAASCILEGFTDAELQEAIRQRTEPGRVEQLFLRLRDPSVVLLRNPYMLNVFCTESQHLSPAAADHIPLDTLLSLLDSHIDRRLGVTSACCGLELSEVREVLSHVTDMLWKQSTPGMYRGRLYTEIESQFADIGRRVLDALFVSGVLSVDIQVQFSERQIAARLYAHRLRQYSEDSTLLLPQIRVERDYDVVVHLLTLVEDPIKLAICLETVDPRWIPALAEGLAYCKPTDQRLQAALLALARRERESWTATDALGQFSLRSRHGWKELLRRFLSWEPEDRALAERSLWSVVKFAPERVARAMQLWYRVHRGVIQAGKGDDPMRYEMARTLRTVTGIDSKVAATHILKRVRGVTSIATAGLRTHSDKERLRFVLRDPLLRVYDRVRVVASAYADDEGFRQFLADLEASDVVTRTRAVNALESIGRIFPERVQPHICSRLQKEQEPSLLARILWASGHLVEQVPEMILDAIETNGPAFWKAYESSATALALLERLARSHPDRVLRLVPSVWDNWAEELLLLLQELIILCQVRCRPSTNLRAPGVSATKEFFRLYQLRAAIVSNLLECGDELGFTDSPLVHRIELRVYGLDFFMIYMAAWMKGREQAFTDHPRADEIIRMVIEAAGVAARHPADVLNRWQTHVRFSLVCDCLKVLIALLSPHSAPESWVCQLPHDWEVLYVVRHLFERGHRSEALIALALNECESHRMQATAQASSERTACLITLQNIVPERVPHMEQERESVDVFFSGPNSPGVRLAAQMNQSPTNILPCLEDAIICPADAMWLKRWDTDAASWWTVLLSKAYARMFRLRPLLPSDSAQIVESMLLALEALPPSPVQQEHVALYQTIQARMNGNRIDPPPIRDTSTPIVQSHRLAAELLARPIQGTSIADLRHVFLDQRGWWEDENYGWNDNGTIKHGWGLGFCLVIFFPAVRLALCALGCENHWWDPAFSWMEERRRARLLSKEIWFKLSEPRLRDPWREISRIEAILHECPDQEMLHAIHGHLLLVEGNLDQAQCSLNSALKSPLSVGDVRGGVLYNLACVYARKGDEEACRSHLLEAGQYKELSIESVRQDPDLQTMLDRTWFQEFLGSLAGHAQ